MFDLSKYQLTRVSLRINRIILLLVLFFLPASTGEMVSHDKRWLSGLEASGWLGTVRSCLLASKEIANLICIKQRCVMILGVFMYQQEVILSTATQFWCQLHSLYINSLLQLLF